MTHALRFTEQDWERIGDDWTAWWAGELDRPLVVIENPVFTRLPEELSINFLLMKPVEEVLDYNQSNLEAMPIFGDAWSKWWPFFGAGVDAAFLGSGLHCSQCVNSVDVVLPCTSQTP
jgi:hypothetical protein